MKHRIVGLLLFMVLVVAGCKEEEKMMKIGVILPLTGDYASYGESVKNGIMIAFDEYKTKELELVIEDDRGDAKTSLAALNKLIVADHINIVIGAVPSGVTLSIAPLAEKKHVVLLSPTSTATAVKTAGDYIFRVCVSDEFEGQRMADYVLQKFPSKRIGILAINNDYGNGLKNDFVKHISDNGGDVSLIQLYNTDLKNFKSLISKFIANNIEVVYMVAQKEQSLIYKQLKELNYKPQIIGSTMIEDPELIENVKAFADGTVYTYRNYNPEDTALVLKRFINSYKRKYGRIPDFYAASGYDAARVAMHTIQNTQNNGIAIKEYLYAIKDFPGVTGHITFDENGDVTQPFGIKTIMNGKFIFIEK